MKKRIFTALGVVVLFFAFVLLGRGGQSDPSPYRLLWTTPSEDWRGTVPLGNGEIGLNAWLTSKGELNFFISRTDSWDDFGRLVKVGAVRISGLTADAVNSPFRQTLDVEKGMLSAEYGTPGQGSRIQLWVDAHRPVIVLELESDCVTAPELSLSLWRKTPGESIKSPEVSDLFWGDKNGIVVQPDTILDNDLMKKRQYLGWLHRNIKTKYFDTISNTQNLSEFAPNRDPLVDRIFGAVVACTDPVRKDSQTLVSKTGIRHRFEIAVNTMQPATLESWTQKTVSILESAQKTDINTRRKCHVDWWNEFRERSWIHLRPRSKSADAAQKQPNIAGKPSETSEKNSVEIQKKLDTAQKDMQTKVSFESQIQRETEHLTQVYLLQRYVDACAGRGGHPIKFNGSIFTVPAEGKPGFADYRRWGPGYWWQNTRLPYFSKPMAGDFDLMKPLFEMYGGLLPLCEYRTKKYLGHGGAYFPECIYFWGDVFPETYGLTPWKDRADKLQESGWHKWEWVGGLEIVLLMYNYYEYTLDNEFLHKRLLPMARSILLFFDEHYQNDPDTGKMKMHPSQSLETWWDCDDPMPEIAGIRYIIECLRTIPTSEISSADRDLWNRLYMRTPEPPTRIDTQTGKKMLAAAARFAKKNNVENPELYAVFPFRLFAFEKPHSDWAKNALEVRTDRGCFGWRQEELFMARLGDAQGAREYLVERAFNKDPNSRFPVFWGPGYDWVPDQDHGSILTASVQSLVLQTDGKKIFILPALPKEWDVEFLLHAPAQTKIHVRTVNGKIVDLTVTPPERKADIVLR